MNDRDWRRIRVDWEELEDAFADSSLDHRYYLDRETGAVHFFSSYLDNEAEEEDERTMTAEGRYVLIPPDRRVVPSEQFHDFIASLDRGEAREALESSLSAPESFRRFEEAIVDLPAALSEWQRFLRERMDARIKSWLEDVAVEPLE